MQNKRKRREQSMKIIFYLTAKEVKWKFFGSCGKGLEKRKDLMKMTEGTSWQSEKMTNEGSDHDSATFHDTQDNLVAGQSALFYILVMQRI